MSSQVQVAPRLPPPLYIPQEHLNIPSRLVSAGGVLQNVPITPSKDGGDIKTIPYSPTNLSHFSPATPDLEKGKGSLHSNSSLSIRFKRSMRLSHRDIASSNDFGPGPKQDRRVRILGSVLGLLLLLLVGNIIYLDIHLMSPPSNSTPLPASNTSPSLAVVQNASQESQTPSSSHSISAPPANTVDAAQSNQAGLKNLAFSCVSQFPGNAVTDAQAFCNRCLSALHAVPTNLFPSGSQQEDAFTKAKVFCQGVGF